MKKLNIAQSYDQPKAWMQEDSRCSWCQESKLVVTGVNSTAICGDCAEEVALAISNVEAAGPSGMEEMSAAEVVTGKEIIH